MTTTTRKTKAQAKGKAATKRPAPKPTKKQAVTEPKPSKGQTPPKPTGEPREGSKQAQLMAMLRRPEGTTISEVTEAFGWQAHTARAVISTLAKRLGVKVEAERKEGVMVYRLPSA